MKNFNGLGENLTLLDDDLVIKGTTSRQVVKGIVSEFRIPEGLNFQWIIVPPSISKCSVESLRRQNLCRSRGILRLVGEVHLKEV